MMTRRRRKRLAKGTGATRRTLTRTGRFGRTAAAFKDFVVPGLPPAAIPVKRESALDQRTKRVFEGFQTSFANLMEARLAEERQVRTQRVNRLKAMIKSIDSVLANPGSRAATRQLKAVRRQLAGILRAEASELSRRVKSSRQVLAKLRRIK